MSVTFVSWKKIAALIVIGFACVASFSMYSVAQSENAGNGLQISPVIFDDPDLQLDPGDSQKVNISVKNVTDSPVNVTTFVEDFSADELEGGRPLIIEDEDYAYGLKSFVRDLPKFALDPGETEETSVTFDIPQTATPGGHYGIVRFSTNSETSEESLTLSASVGTLVLLEVSGEINESIALLDFKSASADDLEAAEIASKSVFNSPPVGFVTRIQNNGNTHVKPIGSINVKNMLGNTVETLNFNQDRSNVLPDSIRRYTNQFNSGFKFGRYTAELTVAYGDNGDQFIEQSISFWIIPWKIVAAAVGAIALLGAVIWYFRTNYRRR